MLVICVTYPTATSASSGQRATDMSQSMKKVHSSLSIALSIFPLHSMYVSIYVTPLALPRSPSCNLHPARVQCNCNYFWFSTLTMGNYIGLFPGYRFTVPDSQFPVTSARNYRTFSRATTKFNFDYAWESPLLRFLCHKLFSNLPSFPELMTQL